ncbi:sugar transferase [Pediococcus pentosaceus]|uniref:sugar transferase n=1 Tax=Pediococcus pentosaceus TaxID=1255 RepID=UPI0003C33B45|nr:sugar transferase [Pediococcus pentosaceus]AHA04801.1 beta-1,6-galactofuranosyltransferase [Pediococcus pentosaceus SL4]QDJ23956.1 hypothetical protein CPU08_02810 [Pediococcus pentosaceus]QHM60855.1 Beta-1,6-galactofuranosyltransferase WbbI [Pediococcus pentosaceus]
MKKFVLEVSDGEKNTAGEKAKKDITDILIKNDYKAVKLNLKRSKLGKLLFTLHEVHKKTRNLNKGDIFIIQYPMYSRYATKTLVDYCKKRQIKTICVIHDIESLRLYKNDDRKIQDELSILQRFDCLITHNASMSAWLREKGITAKISELQIFDYLNEQKNKENIKDNNIVFAGNLAKASFLKKWDIDKKITVFGVNPEGKYPRNVDYKGVKSPDELPKFLQGSFGLIWDGNSMQTNDGVFGEYTKYNNPHKASLYISCELPVIVWDHAAIADFVRDNNIGLVVSNIYDLQKMLSKMSNNEYLELVKNTKTISKKIRSGYFTLNSIKRAIESI